MQYPQCMTTSGILVAADMNQEWLLPWWWHYYSQHNDDPVAFIDLGMSPQALQWCKERGLFLPLPPLNLPLFTKETIPHQQREQWERLLGKYMWNVRPIWFIKPFLLPLSPFDTTLWIDLDCMIRGSLESIFQIMRFGVQIAIAKEGDCVQQRDRDENLLLEGEVSYNTGVIGYTKDAEFLRLYIEKVYAAQHQFISDQNVLSRVLFENKIPTFELPRIFNWSLCDGINEQAVVHHYCGAFWKMAILKSIYPNLGENPSLPPLFSADIHF